MPNVPHRVHLPQPRSDDSWADYMALCSDLGRLATDDDIRAHEELSWPWPDHYPDEPPALPDSDWYEPDPDEVAWLYGQSGE